MPLQRNRGIDEPLIDGLMEYGSDEVLRDDKRKVTGKTFSPKGRLWFNYREISEYDTTIYQGITSGENIKIKTYYIPHVEEGIKVKIGGDQYDITGTNADADRMYRYWVLRRVKA